MWGTIKFTSIYTEKANFKMLNAVHSLPRVLVPLQILVRLRDTIQEKNRAFIITPDSILVDRTPIRAIYDIPV